jgi:uncharacterized protein
MNVSAPGGRPRIGIAWSRYVHGFLERHGEAVDFVEIPFELLQYDPSVVEISSLRPIVLHCASLSLAGSVAPSDRTVSDLQRWIERTETPWVGEHLSFILAERGAAGHLDEHAPGEPFNLGYTACPPLSRETADLVLGALDRAERRLHTPLLLENPPVYFVPPGSTLSPVELTRIICERSPVGLLLDLSHFLITARNLGLDAREALSSLPLERVVEVHVSGFDVQVGAHWDNHATTAPDAVLELLPIVLARASVRAITLEYNWCSRFPASALLAEIGRTRRAAGLPAAAA